MELILGGNRATWQTAFDVARPDGHLENKISKRAVPWYVHIYSTYFSTYFHTYLGSYWQAPEQREK